MSILHVNEIEDEKHFIFSSPKYEDVRGNMRAVWKTENITEGTVLLYFLINWKPKCIATFLSSGFTRGTFGCNVTHFGVSCLFTIEVCRMTDNPNGLGVFTMYIFFVDICG